MGYVKLLAIHATDGSIYKSVHCANSIFLHLFQRKRNCNWFSTRLAAIKQSQFAFCTRLQTELLFRIYPRYMNLYIWLYNKYPHLLHLFILFDCVEVEKDDSTVITIDMNLVEYCLGKYTFLVALLHECNKHKEALVFASSQAIFYYEASTLKLLDEQWYCIVGPQLHKQV